MRQQRISISGLQIKSAVSAAVLTLCLPLSAQSRAVRPSTTQQIEQAAGAAREKGDVVESIKLYERALAAEPSWQEGWWYYGSLFYDANQYPAAVRAFHKLVALNKALGNGWAMLGLSEFETRDYENAYADLRSAQRLGVNDASLEKIVDYHLGLLLNANGDSDGALVLLSSLYLKGVRSEDLQVAMGLSLLRAPVFPSDLDSSRDALVHEAGNLAAELATKQLEKAELSFRDLLTRYPKVQFLHYAYGGMLASQGHDAAAEAQFKEEAELSPDSVLPYLEWSFVTMKTKDYVQSKLLAQKAVELQPNSFLAHYILGNSLLLSGDPKAALPELEEAKKLAPQSPDIRYSLSRAHARLGEPELARQEQAEFLALQKKNATDRLELLKRYPGAPAITGIRPTTAQ